MVKPVSRVLFDVAFLGPLEIGCQGFWQQAAHASKRRPLLRTRVCVQAAAVVTATAAAAGACPADLTMEKQLTHGLPLCSSSALPAYAFICQRAGLA